MAYYGVWAGHKTGIFDNWNDCQSQTKGFKGAKFKKLNAKTLEAAKKEFDEGYVEKSKNSTSEKKSTSSKSSSKHEIQNYHLMNGIHIFCDGACQGNPAPSASGVAIFMNGVLRKLYTGGYVVDGSNNISELKAVIFCLEKAIEVNRPLTIYIDSQYAINVTSLWSYNWSKNGWMSSNKEPVKNKELAEKAFNLYKKAKPLIKLQKVKSHIGEVGNELADRMAIYGLKNKIKEWQVYESHDIDSILKIKY